MTLDMQLLGPPRIAVAGVPIEVDTRKAVALLAHLAVEPGPHPRDRLVHLLWPDADTQRGRSSLRRTLSTARTALGGAGLEADRRVVRLEVDRSQVDVHRLEDLVTAHDHVDRTTCPTCAHDLATIAAVASHDFLDGLVVRDAAPFEQWVLHTGERLRLRIDGAMARLATALAEAGDVAGAIAVARERLRRDPLREDAARALMRLHARAGDRSSSVDVYRDLVAVLDAELGVTPLEDTVALHRALLHHAPPDAPAPEAAIGHMVDGPDASPPDAPPLVGRDDVLAEVVGHLGTPRAVVVVTSGTGMGRSRLLQEARPLLRGDDRIVLGASGSPGSAEIPFGVLHHALSPLVSSVDPDTLPDRVVAELGRVFPTLPTRPIAPAGTRAAFYGALAHLATVRGSVVMVVDDLQWVDASTLEALSFLTAHHGVDVRVLAALDIDSVGEGGVGIEDLRRRATTVTLEALDVDAVAALAAHAGRDVDAAAVRRETRGVPLLVVERLRESAGGVSDSLRRVFAWRLETVSGAASQLLDALVVLGAPVDAGLVRGVSGRSPEEADAALAELQAAGLVIEDADGVEVAYGVVARMVTARLAPARRRSLHRRWAVALADAGHEPVLVARHHQAAGDEERAAPWFVRAGDAAQAVHAHGEAIAAYEAALASDHVDRGAVHARIAASWLRVGDYDRAVQHYETSLALTRDPTVEYELGVLHRRLRRWDLAVDHLERVVGDEVDADLEARTLAELALVAALRGATARGRTLADRALARAADAGDQDVRAVALNAAAMLEQGGRRHERLRQAAALAVTPTVRMAVLNNLAASLDDDEAVAAGREAAVIADALGDRHLAAAVHNTLGDVLRRTGRDPDARDEVRRAVELFAGVATDAPGLDPDVWLLADL